MYFVVTVMYVDFLSATMRLLNHVNLDFSLHSLPLIYVGIVNYFLFVRCVYVCNAVRSNRFYGFHQQDSHELLRHLLDGIREEERHVS